MADWLVWKDENGHKLNVMCSECNYEIPLYQMIPGSCPQCGATMEHECEWKKYQRRTKA